jgi:hypothetical protein
MAEGQSEKSGLALTLSRAQSSAIAARMLTVEQGCREIERFLDGYAGVFYQYVGVLPEEVRQAIRSLITEILRGIAAIRHDLALPQRQMEITQLVTAYLSQVWVTLQETHAHSLRGYGALAEEVGAYLDPRVDELLGLVARLRNAIESGKKPFREGAEDKSACT